MATDSTTDKARKRSISLVTNRKVRDKEEKRCKHRNYQVGGKKHVHSLSDLAEQCLLTKTTSQPRFLSTPQFV